MRILIAAALCAMGVSGCAQNSHRIETADALRPALTNERITRSTDETESALGALYTRASLFDEPAKGEREWDEVILAGMDYVDEACAEYLDALHLAGSGAAPRPLGSSVGGLFARPAPAPAPGEVIETADTRETAPNVAALKAALDKSRATYRSKLFRTSRRAERRNKFGALAAIRGYLALCGPSGLHAEATRVSAG